jgi:hypothetical protein
MLSRFGVLDAGNYVPSTTIEMEVNFWRRILLS